MLTFAFLLALLNSHATQDAPTYGAIEATIRGTTQPLDVALLFRDGEEWKSVDQRVLPASTRSVRFDRLRSGVYQVLIHGAGSMEQFATKFVIGSGDTRRATITIDPVILTGHMTLGGGIAGPGTVSFRHKELRWRGTFDVAADGSFRVSLWQRGTYLYAARAASMATSYTGTIDLEGASPINFPIDIPDGRITGTLRDGRSGTAIGGASIALETDGPGSVQHVHVTTDDAGRFELNGLRFGRQTVRVVSPRYLEPSPVVFDLDATNWRRDLDIRLDSGRTTPVVVMDADDHPVANATVFAVTDARRRSRATTDEHGLTSLAVPENETVTVFVIPNEGGFTALPLARADGRQVTLHLPRALSSLRILARTSNGKPMPSFALLMRYNGAIMPLEIAEELTAVQGVLFLTNEAAEANLRNIPAGRYEFWPYRTPEEAESILATSRNIVPPIQVDVHNGENSIAVTFKAR